MKRIMRSRVLFVCYLFIVLVSGDCFAKGCFEKTVKFLGRSPKNSELLDKFKKTQKPYEQLFKILDGNLSVGFTDQHAYMLAQQMVLLHRLDRDYYGEKLSKMLGVHLATYTQIIIGLQNHFGDRIHNGIIISEVLSLAAYIIFHDTLQFCSAMRLALQSAIGSTCTTHAFAIVPYSLAVPQFGELFGKWDARLVLLYSVFDQKDAGLLERVSGPDSVTLSDEIERGFSRSACFESIKEHDKSTFLEFQRKAEARGVTELSFPPAGESTKKSLNKPDPLMRAVKFKKSYLYSYEQQLQDTLQGFLNVSSEVLEPKKADFDEGNKTALLGEIRALLLRLKSPKVDSDFQQIIEKLFYVDSLYRKLGGRHDILLQVEAFKKDQKNHREKFEKKQDDLLTKDIIKRNKGYYLEKWKSCRFDLFRSVGMPEKYPLWQKCLELEYLAHAFGNQLDTRLTRHEFPSEDQRLDHPELVPVSYKSFALTLFEYIIQHLHPAVDAPETASAVDAPETASAVDAPETASAVDAPETASAVDAPETASAVDAPETASTVDAPETASAVDAPETASAVDAPETASSVQEPGVHLFIANQPDLYRNRIAWMDAGLDLSQSGGLGSGFRTINMPSDHFCFYHALGGHIGMYGPEFFNNLISLANWLHQEQPQLSHRINRMLTGLDRSLSLETIANTGVVELAGIGLWGHTGLLPLICWWYKTTVLVLNTVPDESFGVLFMNDGSWTIVEPVDGSMAVAVNHLLEMHPDLLILQNIDQMHWNVLSPVPVKASENEENITVLPVVPPGQKFINPEF